MKKKAAVEAKDLAAIEAQKVIDEVIEAHPRLKMARDAMRRGGNDQHKIAEDTLKIFRQRMKE